MSDTLINFNVANVIYEGFARKPLLKSWWCVGVYKTYQSLDICFKFLKGFSNFLGSCLHLGCKNLSQMFIRVWLVVFDALGVNR
ncbi:hypothetical protein Zmor_017951 [Zophobas morio]|uniref:Uncharacterized protein n=1 Tax=Zophobas morio TaxID=2755281 RepID=A0AA38I9N0_9CUCU|nr:hypothetical protein Zmor_017951 [Zophobas morio]